MTPTDGAKSSVGAVGPPQGRKASQPQALISLKSDIPFPLF